MKVNLLNAWSVRLCLVIHSSFVVVHAGEDKSNRDYKLECEHVKKYAVSEKYQVDCLKNYHHYNSTKFKSSRKRLIDKSKLKIAEFNVLHPGSSKTRFKDYQKIASLINKWDIIGVTELLPLVGRDLKQNTALVKFIEVYGPSKIKFYQSRSQDLEKKLIKEDNSRKIKTLKRAISNTTKLVAFYKEEIEKSKLNYRTPGYLKILDELHKLKGGSNWALVLAPKGEAAKSRDVHELVGYFYKANIVKPVENKYCDSIDPKAKYLNFACTVKMDSNALGKDNSDIFSRRPFMASFKANNFDFTLLTSHVVFSSPDGRADRENIMRKAFGVGHYDDLSVGLNSTNYARFAEVKVTLDFIDRFKKRFGKQDVIFMGDLNLKFSNQFWPNVLDSAKGFELFIENETSLSRGRYYSNDEETNGLSNDYDHFIFDPKETSECTKADGSANAKVESFYKGAIGRYVRRLYEVRTDRVSEDEYNYNESKYQRLIDRFVTPFKNGKETILKIGNKKIVTGGTTHSVRGLIDDNKEIDRYVDYFQSRILKSQLSDSSYYSYFIDILSDHMPIVLECDI